MTTRKLHLFEEDCLALREGSKTGGTVRFDSTPFCCVLFVFLTCSIPAGKVRQWQAGSELVPGVVYLSPHWRVYGDAVSHPGLHMIISVCVCVCTV